MEQIIVTIDTEAEVQIEVKEYSGPGCQKLTEALEKALGETTRDTKTHEFHQQQRAAVRIANRA